MGKTKFSRKIIDWGGVYYNLREEGRGSVKGGKYIGTADDLTLGDRHTMQLTGYVSQKCTLETYVILLTPISLI